jgi:hypothetical protein
MAASLGVGTPDYSTADDGLMQYAQFMEGRPPVSIATRWQRFWAKRWVFKNVSSNYIKAKSKHLFGKNLVKHGFGGLLKKFGGDTVAATHAIFVAAQTMYQNGFTMQTPKGHWEGRVMIKGIVVIVRGVVHNGKFMIGTACAE